MTSIDTGTQRVRLPATWARSALERFIDIGTVQKITTQYVWVMATPAQLRASLKDARFCCVECGHLTQSSRRAAHTIARALWGDGE